MRRILLKCTRLIKTDVCVYADDNPSLYEYRCACADSEEQDIAY